MRASMAADAGVEQVRSEGQSTASNIWMFIAFDCTSFGLFFMVFMIERLQQAELFDRSARHLNPELGLLNTCILITSSWLVALGNRAGREGAFEAARFRLWCAFAVGSLFALVKAFEYGAKIRSGITVFTNEFYTFYFALTGVHLFHYLIGLVVLGVLAAGAGRAKTGEERGRYLAWLDGGALYWHMVDLLWVFLYAILYLLGAK
jgi:nitric oxide reductase NorE protein